MNTIIFKPKKKHFKDDQEYFNYRRNCICDICKKIIQLKEKIIIKGEKMIHEKCHSLPEDKQEKNVLLGDITPVSENNNY